jgi:hypothetical protein
MIVRLLGRQSGEPSVDDWRRAVILAEIFGPPRGEQA